MASDPAAHARTPAAAMSAGVRFRLSMMMFLEFFIWGAWFELGFVYIPSLGFSEWWQPASVFAAFNVGAVIALFFSTQFADRSFAAERFLAFSHLVGGLAILGLFFLTGDQNNPAPFWPFLGLMLLHSIFYVPTISITNSIAFANLADPTRQFGPVRVWGTIGWIVASWPFIFILVDWAKVPAMSDVGFTTWFGKALGDKETALSGAQALAAQKYIFLVAGIASLVLAAFSLALPHTPPKPARSQADTLAWLKAMRLLKNPAVLVLFIVTFIDAAVHQSFFVWTGSFLGGPVGIQANWVTPVMKIGQIAEILTMLFLGNVLKNLGWRWTMVLGVLGHAARFAVFAYYPHKEAAILINVLHGICYAFFFATVYIFVDEFFPKDVRSSAQGLFNVLILGAGPFVANYVCGRLRAHYTSADGVLDYTAVFQYSIGAGLAAALILAVFFHPRKRADDPGFNRVEEDAPPAP
jgi:nucleoside transporter